VTLDYTLSLIFNGPLNSSATHTKCLSNPCFLQKTASIDTRQLLVSTCWSPVVTGVTVCRCMVQLHLYLIIPVPDRSRNIPEVVLVRRWAVGVLGIWRGEDLGEGWDKGGQFTSNLRPRWTIPVTARRVPSK
jgi:hypothetical protein